MSKRFLRSVYWLGFWGCFFLIKTALSQTVESLCLPALYNHSHLTYKADRQNWKITQSPITQFMYFANSKGLLEFDGARWRVYELPNKQIVRSVWADANGLIYTGALGEFGYWKESAKGVLQYHSLKKLVNDQAFQNEEVWHILPTPSGVLFQSFAFMYLYQGGKVKKLKTPGNILFTFQAGKSFYLEVIDKGLFELKGERFQKIAASDFLGKEAIYTVATTAIPKELLIGTNKGLYRFDGKQFSVFNQELHDFIRTNQLNAATRLRNGNYVFGTIRQGLVLTNQRGEILYKINQKNGLQNNTVLSLFEDEKGNVWAGLDNGISMLALSSPFKYFEDLEGKIGTVYDIITFQNTLYLATNHGVFAKALTSKTEFQLIRGLQGQAWDLEVFDDQLLCGHNNGTYRIEGDKAIQLSDITGGWQLKRALNKPSMLIQSTYTKLCLYEKDAQGKWVFKHTMEGFSNPTAQWEELPDGRLILNTKNAGLVLLQPASDYKTAKKVTNLGLRAINLLKQDKIYITSEKGVQEFDQKQSKFIPSARFEESKAQKLFAFSDKSWWELTVSGGLRLLKEPNQWQVVPLQNNFLVDDYETIVSHDSVARIFGRENGFAFLASTDLLTQNNVSPLIRGLEVEQFPELTQYYSKNGRSGEIALKYNQNNLRFKFSSTDFASSVKYSYWLENASKDWSDFSDNSVKEFNNLMPGNYTLHLKTNTGLQEATLNFSILPPWYWNLWSKLVYCLFFCLICFFLYQWHKRRLAAENERLQQQKALELKEQKEKNRQEIIRIRNEQLEQDLVRKSEELANSTMELIKKNELFQEIQTKVSEMQVHSKPNDFQQLSKWIETHISTGKDWQVFEQNFNQVHEQFFKKLMENYPDLSKGDLKLAAYLRMNLSSKEISQLLNITYRSVELKRYRLRKKMNLGQDENLAEFMMSF